MMPAPLDIVVLGLSITSSWGNGHATTYRPLLRALGARGHRVLFLERASPSHAQAPDQPSEPCCEVELYASREELADRHQLRLQGADLVIVGSSVQEGQAVIDWVQAHARGPVLFYDMDTPMTLAQLVDDRCEYLARRQVPRFDMYLSFTGGPILRRLERTFGAVHARPLYCAFDPAQYFPTSGEPRWELGYLGSYSPDRQEPLRQLLMMPAIHDSALRLVVAGVKYPPELQWPENIRRIGHLPPGGHREFYGAQRWTLNLTRAGMRTAGYSPSFRLFEAAACGVPVISDEWPGMHEFFEPGREVMIARSCEEVRRLLCLPPDVALSVGRAARRRALSDHTAARRAEYLESLIDFVQTRRARPRRVSRKAPVAAAHPLAPVHPQSGLPPAE